MATTSPLNAPAVPDVRTLPLLQQRPDEVARISSEQLLAGALEVHIEHRGALYRLRQTSLGKLILTK